MKNIQSRLNQTTQNAVACALHALKISAGLLCSGCNTRWGSFVKNNKFVFLNNSCMALSNACFGLLKGFDTLRNDSRADVTNLTDVIAQFIGEDISTTEGLPNGGVPLIYNLFKKIIINIS